MRNGVIAGMIGQVITHDDVEYAYKHSTGHGSHVFADADGQRLTLHVA